MMPSMPGEGVMPALRPLLPASGKLLAVQYCTTVSRLGCDGNVAEGENVGKF